MPRIAVSAGTSLYFWRRLDLRRVITGGTISPWQQPPRRENGIRPRHRRAGAKAAASKCRRRRARRSYGTKQEMPKDKRRRGETKKLRGRVSTQLPVPIASEPELHAI